MSEVSNFPKDSLGLKNPKFKSCHLFWFFYFDKNKFVNSLLMFITHKSTDILPF